MIPGPNRQDVDYLPDPAVGDGGFGFPSRRPGRSGADAGHVARRGSRSGWRSWPGDSRRSEPDPDTDTDLRVFVPKAEIVPVDVSFAIGPDFIDHFGLWQQLTAEEQAPLKDDDRRRGATGCSRPPAR